MLFQSVAQPERRYYVEQGTAVLEGSLESSAFQEAWQDVARRHAALRTAFVWRDTSRPVQAVLRSARVPVDMYDLRAETDPERAWKRVVDSSRAEGFDLTQPPLCRIAVGRIGDGSYRLLWAMHHLIHDAWSTEILLREVLTRYTARLRRETIDPPAAPSYRDFVAWVRAQDWSPFESSCRAIFRGISMVRLPRIDRAPSECRALAAAIPKAAAGAVQAAARRLRVTLNVLTHAAFAVALHLETRLADLGFGTVVSGRSQYPPGAGALVGLLINTLPVRILVTRDAVLEVWLQNLLQHLHASLAWEHLPAGHARRFAEVDGDRRLFDAVLVFQNVFESVDRAVEGGLVIRDIQSTGHSELPLTVRATPAGSIRLEALYDSARLTTAAVERILRSMTGFLKLCSTQAPHTTLGHLLDSLSKEGDAVQGKGAVSGLANLAAIKPKIVRLSEQNVVTFQEPERGRLPLTVIARQSGMDASNWLRANRELVDRELILRGGVLFRGFALSDVEKFREFTEAFSSSRMEYKERSTPRTEIGDRIYTSTEYPAHQHIAWHNEFSYAYTWPMQILFYCVQPPDQGGETPVTDSRLVYGAIDPAVRRRFEEKGVAYIRNYGQGIDLTWQEAFQTSDRLQVEEHCRNASLEWEWLSGDRLRTRQRRRATAIHPVANETVWFNQAHLFHVSNLGGEGEQAMRSLFVEQHLPRNAYFGDGSAIPPADLENIRGAYRSAEQIFAWQQGDVLVLDNMLAAHGRRPFAGSRRVLTAMVSPFTTPLR